MSSPSHQCRSRVLGQGVTLMRYEGCAPRRQDDSEGGHLVDISVTLRLFH
jgi:hypothetical protein